MSLDRAWAVPVHNAGKAHATMGHTHMPPVREHDVRSFPCACANTVEHDIQQAIPKSDLPQLNQASQKEPDASLTTQ
jgi:hypothetical protein